MCKLLFRVQKKKSIDDVRYETTNITRIIHLYKMAINYIYTHTNKQQIGFQFESQNCDLLFWLCIMAFRDKIRLHHFSF